MSALNGWIILDKPLNITSAAAVGRVKRLLKPKKIGHGGTLDPLASGILPLALGEATKLFNYVAANEKGYRFTIQFGEARTTDDAEGEVIETSSVFPREEQVIPVLKQFEGEILQTPPAFSAIKVDGKRAYDMARAGEEVTLKARPIQIYKLLFLNMESHSSASFEVTCGKGTYVRSLARDIAQALGTVGYVSALRRIQVGRFSEKDAISLDSLEEMVHKGAPNEYLHPIASVLDDIPALKLEASQVADLKQGRVVKLLPTQTTPEGIVLCMDGDTPQGLANREADTLKVVRNFNLV